MSLSAKNCQTHNLIAVFILLIELVSESMHLELWFSTGISSTVSMWTHLEILGSYVLCSFVQRSILSQPWGKCLCVHNVLLAATIAARRGIQSEQKLDLVWMRSWKKKQIWTKISELRPDLEGEEKQQHKVRTRRGWGLLQRIPLWKWLILCLLAPEHSYMMSGAFLELQVATECSFYTWC